MPAASDGPTSPGLVTAAAATVVALRASVILTATAGVLVTVAGGLIGGATAALGAGLGSLIALVFFAAGQYAVIRVLSRGTDFALSGALLIYLTQILVLFLLIALLKGQTWLDVKWFASAIVLCTFVWIGAQLWTVQRTKVLIVEPTPSAPDDVEAEQ